MDTIGIKATAIVLMVCAVLPLRLTPADLRESAEGERTAMAEKALIAEIFGDDPEALGGRLTQPEFVLEMRLTDRLQLAVVDGGKLRTGDCKPSSGAKFKVANGEGQPYSGRAGEHCE